MIAALPREGSAFATTFTAPNADLLAFTPMLVAFLSDKIASGEVLGYVGVSGRRGREHVHAHHLVITRSTFDLVRLRESWARVAGATDPKTALRARLVTDWKAYREGKPSTFRDQLARDRDGRTVGVLAYAGAHAGALMTGGSLASLALPEPLSRPLDDGESTSAATGGAGPVTALGHVLTP